jgi:uncharacterized protein (DUF488 family)
VATLYTIGFTRSTAECFISRLEEAGVRVLLDVRLKADGQLSGFAKSVDLQYFLKRLTSIAYKPFPILAPTAEMLRAYRKRQMSWEEYERGYLDVIRSRNLGEVLSLADIDGACLLCSEHTAGRCHRRLAAEYIQQLFRGSAPIEIVHL